MLPGRRIGMGGNADAYATEEMYDGDEIEYQIDDED
jgi:hypothetical protein